MNAAGQYSADKFLAAESPLISCAALAQNLHRYTVLDCRHDLMKAGAGVAAYRAAHIPGAHHLDLDRDLSAVGGGERGRHPLPAATPLAQIFANCGVETHRPVVVHDDITGAYAARCWWLLRWLGHDNVRVLDGGFSQWQDGGYPLSADLPPTEKITEKLTGNFSERENNAGWIVNTEEVAAIVADANATVTLLDARAAARWHGWEEPIDPVRGRIPSAKNRPHQDNLQADGRMKTAAVLRREFADITVKADGDIIHYIHYCGSGVTACHNILACAVAGLPLGRLYAGSWSAWCANSARAVERD